MEGEVRMVSGNSIGLIAVIAGIACIPGCDNGMLLLLPGVLLAAVVFPQGVNSAGGTLYLVLACVLDVFIAYIQVVRHIGMKVLSMGS